MTRAELLEKLRDLKPWLEERLGVKVEVLREQDLTNPYIRYTAERDAVVV
jgi:predicted nucleotidyltransferase